MSVLVQFLVLFAFSVLSPVRGACRGHRKVSKPGFTPKPLIANGKIAPVGRFPYMCSLRERSTLYHVCGATLIHPRWVLTAAHCVDPNSHDSVGLYPTIFCGTHNVCYDSPQMEFSAVKAVVHHRWNGNILDGHDIALLQLNREANIGLPSLNEPNGRLEDGTLLAALGWGKNENNIPVDELQLARNLEFVSVESCQQIWKRSTIKEDIMMCAGLGKEDTCRGDSGGPLLLLNSRKHNFESNDLSRDRIVGVTSFGPECGGHHPAPGVYTDVAYFSDWIQEVTNGKVEDSEPPSMPPTTDNSFPPAISPGQEIKEEAVSSLTAQDGDGDLDDGITEMIEFDNSILYQEMIVALKEDRAKDVAMLLDDEMDVDSRYNDSTIVHGSRDSTLLHWAALFDASKSAEVLIKHDASLSLDDAFGKKPIHICGRHGSLAVAEVLLKHGADPDVVGFHAIRPLHEASQHGHPAVVKLLLQKGAAVNAVTNFGDTPLIWACKKGHPVVVQILLKKKADADIASSDGDTALHYAARRNDDGIVKALVSAKAQVDATNNEGNTPLHEAAKHGHLNVVKVLVDAGATTTIRAGTGNRPIDIVCIKASPACSAATKSAIEKLVAA